MRFSKAVVKCRIPILIIALLLMIPSALGMAGTRINYDMLDYLPEDMDTVVGQNELLEEFNKGAFSFLIMEAWNTWRLCCGTTLWQICPCQWNCCRMKFSGRLTQNAPP